MPQPNGSKKAPSNFYTIVFIICLSLVCASVLAILASALEKPKEIARDLDRSKQMMIAARILSHDGHFLIRDEEGEYIPAKYTEGGVLVPGSPDDIPTSEQILDVYRLRLQPMLVDDKGNLKTFKEAGINEEEYVAKFKKRGYHLQPLKLVYRIIPNPKEGEKKAEQETEAEGYVIPVNGFGLWDAIYGYLAVAPDGNTVIGISWYEQKETPGLGANIAEPEWQSHFPGKKLFQLSASGETDFKTAPLGITVVRGKVNEVLGDTPKAKSAVDGMAGATLTGNGVTSAYRDVLEAYRPFLIKLHEEKAEGGKQKAE